MSFFGGFPFGGFSGMGGMGGHGGDDDDGTIIMTQINPNKSITLSTTKL